MFLNSVRNSRWKTQRSSNYDNINLTSLEKRKNAFLTIKIIGERVSFFNNFKRFSLGRYGFFSRPRPFWNLAVKFDYNLITTMTWVRRGGGEPYTVYYSYKYAFFDTVRQTRCRKFVFYYVLFVRCETINYSKHPTALLAPTLANASAFNTSAEPVAGRIPRTHGFPCHGTNATRRSISDFPVFFCRTIDNRG